MVDSTRSKVNELDHPGVLSRERLEEILCERSIHPQYFVDLDKDALVQLFYNHVTPLPQRPYQLRRVKRVIHPIGKESKTSKGETLTITRSTKRKSEETMDATASKLARAEQRNISYQNQQKSCLSWLNWKKIIIVLSIIAFSLKAWLT